MPRNSTVAPSVTAEGAFSVCISTNGDSEISPSSDTVAKAEFAKREKPIDHKRCGRADMYDERQI
jgi:hypothetical protein